jgi:hypothetical protein
LIGEKKKRKLRSATHPPHSKTHRRRDIGDEAGNEEFDAENKMLQSKRVNYVTAKLQAAKCMSSGINGVHYSCG